MLPSTASTPVAWEAIGLQRATSSWRLVLLCARRTLFDIVKRRLGPKVAEELRHLKDLDSLGANILDLELERRLPEWASLNISDLSALLEQADGPKVLQFICHTRLSLSESARKMRQRQHAEKSYASYRGERAFTSLSAGSFTPQVRHYIVIIFIFQL